MTAEKDIMQFFFCKVIKWYNYFYCNLDASLYIKRNKKHCLNMVISSLVVIVSEGLLLAGKLELEKESARSRLLTLTEEPAVKFPIKN